MGGIVVKKPHEIQKIREACRAAATVLERVCQLVEAGVNTYDLDQAAKRFMAEIGCESACYNYSVGDRVYPAYTCLSVNEEVVHGIGSLNKVIQEGDNISVDVVVRYDGYLGDNARTLTVGTCDKAMTDLIDATEKALYLGIEQAKPGNRVGDISGTIQRFIESKRYSVVREFVGHGIGTSMHEEPQVPNFGKRGKGPLLKPGMTIAIEPMVTSGRKDVKVLSDGWTAVAKDGKPAAHFEHTVLITKNGAEILTKC